MNPNKAFDFTGKVAVITGGGGVLCGTSDRTPGLIGVGRIGTAVVNRMKPFGYRIVGYDPYQPSGHEKAVGYHRVDSLADLLSEADIVSLHCPLTE